MRVLAVFAAAVVLSLVGRVGDVTVDWERGTLTAQGGAAADIRMPSPDLARPGAERRARAAGLAKLRAGLLALPLGGGRTLSKAAVERAVARATTVAVDYQSNGGAVVRLAVRFGDWDENVKDGAGPVPDPTAPPSEVILSVAVMPLGAAPIVVRGGRELMTSAARYKIGPPPPSVRALSAHGDAQGRLVLQGAGSAGAAPGLARVLIYLDKVAPPS